MANSFKSSSPCPACGEGSGRGPSHLLSACGLAPSLALHPQAGEGTRLYLRRRRNAIAVPTIGRGSRPGIQPFAEAAVDLAGVALEDLVLVLVGEPRHLVDVTLGIVIMVAGARI